MIKLQIVKELKRRIPWLINTFGDTELFISYVKEALKINEADSFQSLTVIQKTDLFKILSYYIKYENDILLISPWNLFLDLRQNLFQENTAETAINVEHPYKVFNVNGDLIYTVKNHFGIFGESRLDKHLILNSVNTSTYFLKYKTYSGTEKIKLLLVNLHSANSTVSNHEFKILESNKISNLTIVNNSGALLNIYQTITAFITDSNFAFNRPENLHTILNNNIKTFNISKSCYFLIDRPVNINHTKITYPVSNIIFIGDSQSPFFIASNMDVNTVNKKFNRTIQFTNKPLDDIITITPYNG